MQALKILLRCWLIAFVSIFVMDIDKAWAGEDAAQADDTAQADETAQAEDVGQADVQSSPPPKVSPKASPKTAKKVSKKVRQKSKKNKAPQKAKKNNKVKQSEKENLPPASPSPNTKKKDSPILGEDDSGVDEEEEEIESDEDDVSPSKPNNASQGNDKKKLSKSELDKENKKNKKRDEKRAKLLEGFRQAEEFHKTWFNLSSEKIKHSHEKLKQFCKVACTKKNCMDDQVANQCHLMCPASTRKQCPDPLKQGDTDREEVTIGSEDPSADMLQPRDDLDVKSSIEEADKALRESEGEGG